MSFLYAAFGIPRTIDEYIDQAHRHEIGLIQVEPFSITQSSLTAPTYVVYGVVLDIDGQQIPYRRHNAGIPDTSIESQLVQYYAERASLYDALDVAEILAADDFTVTVNEQPPEILYEELERVASDINFLEFELQFRNLLDSGD